MRALNDLAYFEFNVAHQFTGGELAVEAKPPHGFVMYELGYGIDQRPCSDCHRPCTLDFTLHNLREINRGHIREGQKQDVERFSDRQRAQYGVERPTQQQESGKRRNGKRKHERRDFGRDQRALRDTLRRAGIRVVKGQYVDERRDWVPNNPNRFGRGGIQRRDIIGAGGKVVGVKVIDIRAKKIIREHRKRAKAAQRAA